MAGGSLKGMRLHRLSPSSSLILFLLCIYHSNFVQPAAATWRDEGHMDNTNFSHFDSEGPATKVSIVLLVILIPFYVGVGILVFIRRNKFPIVGLYPSIMLVNNVITIATLIARCVLYMYWPVRGPPCGLEFVVLQATVLPFVLNTLIRGWFLMFKNEITSHLREVSEKVQAQIDAKAKEHIEKKAGNALAVPQEKSSNEAKPVATPRSKIQQLLETATAAPKKASISGKSPTTADGKQSPTDVMPEAESGHRSSPMIGWTDAQQAINASPTLEDQAESLLPIKSGSGDFSLKSGSDTMNQTGAYKSSSISAEEMISPNDSSNASNFVISVEAMSEDAKSTVIVIGQSSEAVKSSSALGSVAEDASEAASSTEVVTSKENNDESTEESALAKELYNGVSGWFVKHRKLISTKFLVGFYIQSMVANAGLIIFLAFIDPDSSQAGDGMYDTQIGKHLFESPPCTVMSIKQWIVRCLMLTVCPLIMIMWLRMRSKPTDAFGLSAFMARSGMIGNLAVLLYCAGLAYAPPHVNTSIIFSQFILFFVSDIFPLIETYTSARKRRAAASGDTSGGKGKYAAQIKQLYRLHVVLRHPRACTVFHDFTRKEFSFENPAFYDEARKFAKFALELERQMPHFPRVGDDMWTDEADEQSDFHEDSADMHRQWDGDGSYNPLESADIEKNAPARVNEGEVEMAATTTTTARTHQDGTTTLHGIEDRLGGSISVSTMPPSTQLVKPFNENDGLATPSMGPATDQPTSPIDALSPIHSPLMRPVANAVTARGSPSVAASPITTTQVNTNIRRNSAHSPAMIATLRSQAKQARDWALELHSRFLVPGSPFEVNVPADIKHDVTITVRHLEKWDPLSSEDSALPAPPPIPLSSVYKAAHLNVFDLMQRDSFRRFVASPAFADLIHDIEQDLMAAEEKRLTEAEVEVGTRGDKQLAILQALEDATTLGKSVMKPSTTNNVDRQSVSATRRSLAANNSPALGVSSDAGTPPMDALQLLLISSRPDLHPLATVNESRERESIERRNQSVTGGGRRVMHSKYLAPDRDRMSVLRHIDEDAAGVSTSNSSRAGQRRSRPLRLETGDEAMQLPGSPVVNIHSRKSSGGLAPSPSSRKNSTTAPDPKTVETLNIDASA